MKQFVEDLVMLATGRAEIGRAPFIMLMITLFVAWSILTASGIFLYGNGIHEHASKGTALRWIGTAVISVGPAWAANMRLADIGMSRWFAASIPALMAITVTVGQPYEDAAAIGLLAVLACLAVVPGGLARDTGETTPGEAS